MSHQTKNRVMDFMPHLGAKKHAQAMSQLRDSGDEMVMLHQRHTLDSLHGTLNEERSGDLRAEKEFLGAFEIFSSQVLGRFFKG